MCIKKSRSDIFKVTGDPNNYMRQCMLLGCNTGFIVGTCI
jgi:hypothetical protein